MALPKKKAKYTGEIHKNLFVLRTFLAVVTLMCMFCYIMADLNIAATLIRYREPSRKDGPNFQLQHVFAAILFITTCTVFYEFKMKKEIAWCAIVRPIAALVLLVYYFIVIMPEYIFLFVITGICQFVDVFLAYHQVYRCMTCTTPKKIKNKDVEMQKRIRNNDSRNGHSDTSSEEYRPVRRNVYNGSSSEPSPVHISPVKATIHTIPPEKND